MSLATALQLQCLCNDGAVLSVPFIVEYNFLLEATLDINTFKEIPFFFIFACSVHLTVLSCQLQNPYAVRTTCAVTALLLSSTWFFIITLSNSLLISFLPFPKPRDHGRKVGY